MLAQHRTHPYWHKFCDDQTLFGSLAIDGYWSVVNVLVINDAVFAKYQVSTLVGQELGRKTCGIYAIVDSIRIERHNPRATQSSKKRGNNWLGIWFPTIRFVVLTYLLRWLVGLSL